MIESSANTISDRIDEKMARGLLPDYCCFRQYLHRFDYTVTPRCRACHLLEEILELAVFECNRFASERQEMTAQVGLCANTGRGYHQYYDKVAGEMYGKPKNSSTQKRGNINKGR